MNVYFLILVCAHFFPSRKSDQSHERFGAIAIHGWIRLKYRDKCVFCILAMMMMMIMSAILVFVLVFLYIYFELRNSTWQSIISNNMIFYIMHTCCVQYKLYSRTKVVQPAMVCRRRIYFSLDNR